VVPMRASPVEFVVDDMATILFLHGWHSVPGGVKPTHLGQHGHTVINPALDDENFDAARRTAQTEVECNHIDVIVGSSRGGAVAMNLNSGKIPLVLLCPAWKKYGSIRTTKPCTTILHSRADDVVPFADSEELVERSKLEASQLIDVGSDHRLADPEPLAAMLKACERANEKRRADEPDWGAEGRVSECPAWIKEELIQETKDVYTARFGKPCTREHAIAVILDMSRILDASGILKPTGLSNLDRPTTAPVRSETPARRTQGQVGSKRSKPMKSPKKQEAVMEGQAMFFADLAKEAEPPAEGILSRTIHQDDRIKAVVFGFGQGQELSEHTAAKPAMLFFVKGEATVGLGDDVQEAKPGTWVHMPANLKHSIKAKTPVVMLLILLK
jgi:quercetin dioxygenase-like cupin family protein